MLERHIFSEQFCNFVNEILSSIKLPPRKNSSFINSGAIKEQDRTFFINFSGILFPLVFDVVAHANDNEVKTYI